MSFLFHEPFEAALYTRERPFAAPPPPAVMASLGGHRRVMAQLAAGEAFEESFEAWRWRGRGPGPILAPGVVSSLNPARRRLADALFEEETLTWPRRLGGAGFTPPDGTSASFTVNFTGTGDDTYTDETLGAGAASGLGADPGQALATRRGADVAGASAARVA